jgi:hypothetical protein
MEVENAVNQAFHHVFLLDFDALLWQDTRGMRPMPHLDRSSEGLGMARETKRSFTKPRLHPCAQGGASWTAARKPNNPHEKQTPKPVPLYRRNVVPSLGRAGLAGPVRF